MNEICNDLYSFEMTAEKYNMSISVQKTLLIILRKPKRYKLAVYNKNIDQIMISKYFRTVTET